jgi:hypothetical protein
MLLLKTNGIPASDLMNCEGWVKVAENLCLPGELSGFGHENK